MIENPLTDRVCTLSRGGKLEELRPLIDAEPLLLEAPVGDHGRSLLWKSGRHGREDLVEELLAREPQAGRAHLGSGRTEGASPSAQTQQATA